MKRRPRTGLRRRDFTSCGALALLGASAGSGRLIAAARRAEEDGGVRPEAPAKNVIYVFLSGGLSHLDSFDPKPGAATQGPVDSIPTKADGVRFSQYFPRLAEQAGHLAVLRSLHSTQGAHQQGSYFMHTSYEPRGTVRHPSLGSWWMRMAEGRESGLPDHVSIGGDRYGASAGFFPARHGPLSLEDAAGGLPHARPVADEDDATRRRRWERLRRQNAEFARELGHRAARDYVDVYDQAMRLMASEDLAAFEIEREPAAVRERYGDDAFAQGCLLARRLIEHGVRFVEVVSPGWDTHNRNFEVFADQGMRLDRTLATLIDDLHRRGLLEQTLVVVTTEFGRTPDIVVERMGRGHHPQAFSALLAGGGIVGGRVHGATDEEGRRVARDPVSVPDFNATLAAAVGLPLDQELRSPSGRPFTVANGGQPLRRLFGRTS